MRLNMVIYSLVNQQFAIEHGHRKSGFNQHTWWFWLIFLGYVSFPEGTSIDMVLFATSMMFVCATLTSSWSMLWSMMLQDVVPYSLQRTFYVSNSWWDPGISLWTVIKFYEILACHVISWILRLCLSSQHFSASGGMFNSSKNQGFTGPSTAWSSIPALYGHWISLLVWCFPYI